MVRVYLGLGFGAPLLPLPDREAVDEIYTDYPGLLRYLEGFYALSHNPANRDVLRIEQYRQLLHRHLEAAPAEPPFYAAAFGADSIATAEELLGRRDELLENGYSLVAPVTAAIPHRIAVLHELEHLVLDPENDLDLLPGLADRLNALLPALRQRRHPQLQLTVHEPEQLWPGGTRRILAALAQAGDRIDRAPEPRLVSPPSSDLQRWQQRLTATEGKGAPEALAADGSLVILRAERETHLAAYLARTVRENPEWCPGVLMTVRNQTLDNALIMEGLPSMGIPSTSLARPSLQVLKLVTAFLWDPIEVERVMEFVSLVNKPFDRDLGQRLANHLADTPGFFGSRWLYTVDRFFEELEARPVSPARRRRAREQYDFWFRRRRHPRDGRVPKAEVRSLFVFLRNWALEAFEEDGNQSGLPVLAAQCERATELLDAQPEADLNYLEVERLVRTVYQPAPTQFQQPERGALRVAYAPSAVTRIAEAGQQELQRLVWWDFVETDPSYFFSRYYPPEIAYLEANGCHLYTPAQRNQLRHWQNLRPVLHTREQLVLCVPHRIDGTEMEGHGLMGDLEAAFTTESLSAITVNIDATGRADGLLQKLRLPRFAPVPIRELDRPRPHVSISRPERLSHRERETPSSVDDLLYYPHKWLLRHQLQLQGTPILSIASQNRLRGNLSHLFVERLLKDVGESGRNWSREDVTDWIDEHADRLFRQEGAVLLEYGQEPERVQFVLTMKKSAWTLVHYIQANGWSIRASEENVEGILRAGRPQPVKGRADLVLERQHDGRDEIAIVDLKWSGKTVFRDLLRNASDVQLALYADLFAASGVKRVHTAFYMLRDASMLCRNELAFAGADTVPAADDHTVVQAETLAKIRRTFDWRWEQLAEGKLEIRCADTTPFLEDLYVNEPLDELLEMKAVSARFDDFQSLIGLIR